MAKLVVLLLAALAFQASVDARYFNYLEEINTEVKELTVFFEKDFPEHHLAIETVHWQCNRLIEVLEVIINKLREETFVVRGEHKEFEHVIYTLEELVQVLRKVTVHRDITSVHELKKYFVLTIHTVLEGFEKLVTITNTYYPEFRYTLKYLLVDFMTALNGIRYHFVHISNGFEVVHAPRHLIKEIHEYTREFTDVLKNFHEPSQIKVALRGYLSYVDEILYKLQDKNILGHKELDLVIYHLTNKLREIVFPLKEIMHENMVDVQVFRTKIVSYCFEVVSIFEQLVQLCEDKILPEELTHFLIKVIYHYWYAVKHVCYEIKFGYKIDFYMPEYYNTEYYTKYGYGLYEKDFHHRFYTPYHHETSYYNYPMYYKNFEHNVFTPYRHESLFPVYKYNPEFFHGKNFNFHKYGMNYYNKFDYKFETPKEFVKNVEVLFQRFYEQFKHTTFDVKEVRPVFMYHIYEFISFLDFCLEMFETKTHFEHFYTDKHFEEFIYKLKEIRTELNEFVHSGIFTNIYEIKERFVHHVEFVYTYLCKWIEEYGFEHVIFKDVCHKFITFLYKVCYQHYGFHHEYVPVKDFTGYFHHTTYATYPTYFNRWLKY